jgi:holo-[acyl-carrier protein] synthase
MIVGVGIDLLEVARFERELGRNGPGFVDQVFSSAEAADCRARRYPARHYAARFAAKEAVFKALGLDSGDASTWREVEIQSCRSGPGQVVLHRRLKQLADTRGVRRVWLSMTHTADLAAAGVILES